MLSNQSRFAFWLLFCSLAASSSSTQASNSDDDSSISNVPASKSFSSSASSSLPLASGLSASSPSAAAAASLSSISSPSFYSGSLSDYTSESFKQLLEQLLQNRLNALQNSNDLNTNVPILLNSFSSGDNDGTYFKRTDNSPGWNKLQGGWGKRQTLIAPSGSPSSAPVNRLVSLNQPTWSALIDQREPVRRSGSWNHLNALWGRKRSANFAPQEAVSDSDLMEANRLSIRSPSNGDWNSLNSMWGRRRRRGWNDLQGGWGKTIWSFVERKLESIECDVGKASSVKQNKTKQNNSKTNRLYRIKSKKVN